MKLPCFDLKINQFAKGKIVTENLIETGTLKEDFAKLFFAVLRPRKKCNSLFDGCIYFIQNRNKPPREIESRCT